MKLRSKLRILLFKDVSFGYTRDKKVLHHISFTVPARSFTALVGVSGCGKSTTASLVMKNMSGYEGRICVGGIPLENIREDSLYQKITRICHDSYLFGTTVEENLRMGNDQGRCKKCFLTLSEKWIFMIPSWKKGACLWLWRKRLPTFPGDKNSGCAWPSHTPRQ